MVDSTYIGNYFPNVLHLSQESNSREKCKVKSELFPIRMHFSGMRNAHFPPNILGNF